MNSEFWNIFQWNSNGFSDRNCSKSGWARSFEKQASLSQFQFPTGFKFRDEPWKFLFIVASSLMLSKYLNELYNNNNRDPDPTQNPNEKFKEPRTRTWTRSYNFLDPGPVPEPTVSILQNSKTGPTPKFYRVFISELDTQSAQLSFFKLLFLSYYSLLHGKFGLIKSWNSPYKIENNKTKIRA